MFDQRIQQFYPLKTQAYCAPANDVPCGQEENIARLPRDKQSLSPCAPGTLCVSAKGMDRAWKELSLLPGVSPAQQMADVGAVQEPAARRSHSLGRPWESLDPR